MIYPKRIEITSQIEEIITFCPRLSDDPDDEKFCRHCVLCGPCVEYWTGDNSFNKGEE